MEIHNGNTMDIHNIPLSNNNKFANYSLFLMLCLIMNNGYPCFFFSLGDLHEGATIHRFRNWGEDERASPTKKTVHVHAGGFALEFTTRLLDMKTHNEFTGQGFLRKSDQLKKQTKLTLQ